MSKPHRATFGLETCMFSPSQMHAEAALRLAASCGMEGLARRGTSLQSMIARHELGLVILGADLDYEAPLTFFSAPTLAAEVRTSLRDDGRLVLFRVRHTAGEGAISIAVRARPIRLSGGAALDASPAALEGPLRAAFDDDEIERELPTRYLQAQIDEWTRGAEPLGGGSQPFFVGRTDCELADQWQFVRLPSLVASARDRLALGGEKGLAVGLKRPLRSFRSEYLRPMFFGDHGRIELAAFRQGERAFFVYRVLGALVPGAPEDKRPLCAVAVETF